MSHEGLADIELCAEPGRATLSINGVPVDKFTTEAQFKVVAGGIPELWIRQRVGRAKIEGRGIVHVMPADERATTTAWLRSLDADELERAALQGLGWGDEGGAAQAILKTLIGWCEASDAAGR